MCVKEYLWEKIILLECVWMMTFNCVIHFNPVIEIFQGEITRLDKSFKEKLNSIILIRNFIQQRMHELKFFAKMREFQFLQFLSTTGIFPLYGWS